MIDTGEGWSATNPAAPRPGDTVIVADLHLRADGSGGAHPDAGRAFGAFVDALSTIARSDPRGLRLILLGDTFDLPMFVEPMAGPDPETAWSMSAVAALDAILDAHAALAPAIAGLLTAGGAIDVVPGNHDRALLLPDVADRFLGRTAASDGRRPDLRRWLVHIPGRLYAEHGHQHHDLNAEPTWLRPAASRTQPGAPLAWALEPPASATRLARAGLRWFRDVGAIRRRRVRYRSADLPAEAPRIGLSAELLVALDHVTPVSPVRLGQRLATIALRSGRRRRPESVASYLWPAAQRVRDVLEGAGLGTPVHVFGHTHEPAVLSLPGGAVPAWYVNPGSWSAVRPAALARRLGTDRHPFVVVSAAEGSEPPASLRSWNASTGRFEAGAEAMRPVYL